MTINERIPEELPIPKEEKRSTHLSGVLHGKFMTTLDPKTRSEFINSAALADIIESGIATPEQYLLLGQQITQKAIKTARTDVYQPRKIIALARQNGANETSLNELEANYNTAVTEVYQRRFKEAFLNLQIWGTKEMVLKVIEDAKKDGVAENVHKNFKRRLRNLEKRSKK